MNSNTDILFVIGQMDIGGTEKHIRNVLPALKHRGLKVSLFVIHAGGALEEPLRDDDVEILHSKQRRKGIIGVISAGLSLFKIIRERKPRAVHFFLPEAYLLGGICSLFLDTKKLMSRRSLNYYQKKRWYAGPLEKLLHRTLDMAFANSEPIRTQLVEEGVPESKVKLIYNGVVALSKLGVGQVAPKRRALGVEDNTVVCVVVANFIPYKGHIDVLRAFAKLEAGEHRNWHLFFIGTGEGRYRKEIEEEINKKRLDEKVTLITDCEDVSGYLSIAEIGILASHEEGFSNALLEYMAAGLAIVATDVGGNPEAIESGVSGLLVSARSPGAMSDSLRELLVSKDLRQEFGLRARERVVRKFSFNASIDQYYESYKSLLKVNSQDRKNHA